MENCANRSLRNQEDVAQFDRDTAPDHDGFPTVTHMAGNHVENPGCTDVDRAGFIEHLRGPVRDAPGEHEAWSWFISQGGGPVLMEPHTATALPF